MKTRIAFCLCVVLALWLCGCKAERKPQQPRQPTELARGVWGAIEFPDEAGPRPGVVLLHGAVGWRPEVAELASLLADSGFVALAIDYYVEAERTPIRSEAKLAAWPAYEGAVRRAVEYLQSLPQVDGEPIGLVGFSRGAFLAVSVASSVPGVGAVVDFYGGGGGGPASLPEDVEGLPPLLILHGDADKIVPLKFAFELRDAVTAAGGEVELHVYPGAGHVFNLSYSSTYREEAARDAHKRTVEFLRKWLVGREQPESKMQTG
jgi:carboxymethylenebutenolidase